mgnify:CR=1 FL=1
MKQKIKGYHTVSVFSFDVFDTVLARTISPPSAVFFLTARRARPILPDGCTPGQFAYSRRRALSNVTAWKGWGVTLLDIYRELRNSLNVSEKVAERIMEIELAVERDVLYPIPDTLARIERVREQGASIAFTSDMHLSSDHIQTLLLDHGIWQPEDQLFVSSEYGVTKHRGDLFRPLLQQLDSKETVVHVGDTYESDVEGAEAAGIASHHVTLGKANRYEDILERYTQETGGMSGAMAGASRYARLHAHAESAREEALRDVAAGVMAPVLAGFVTWLLGCASRRDLDRLYFTSRDGFHLVPMARRLASLLKVSCEFEYLYLSRASVSAAKPDPAKVENSRAARRRLCNYVKREGLCDDEENGFVDLGWRGTIHGYLNEILVEEGLLSSPMPGFFFGLDSDQQIHSSYRTAYFFDKYRGGGYKDVLPDRGIYTLMEMFCTADHGTVMGYEKEDGQVSPTLESSWPGRVESWGFPVVQRTLDSFLDGLAQGNELLSCNADIREPLVDVLRTFWRKPTPEEAAAWGRFPRELDQEEGDVKPLAEPYTGWKALAEFARYGRHANEEIKHKFSWMDGSLTRSGPGLRRAIQTVLWGRELAKYVMFGLAEKIGVADRLGRFVMKWSGRPSKPSET